MILRKTKKTSCRFPLENLFSGELSRNHIENKFSILDIYIQCDFKRAEFFLPVFVTVVSISNSINGKIVGMRLESICLADWSPVLFFCN